MSASRSRQKRKLEPISIEELAGATGMSGFCTFLTRDASVPVPVLDQLETSAPKITAPPSPGLDEDAIVTDAAELAALDSEYGIEPDAPETIAPVTSVS